MPPEPRHVGDRLWIERHTENRGPSAARNTGILAARGEIIVTTDDDVRVEPDWLDQAANALDANVKALLLAPPFYLKGVGDDGVFAWHSALFQALGDKARDVILYHLPYHTGVAITLDLMSALSLTAAAAIALAERVIDAPQGELRLTDDMTLRVNLERTTREVAERLRAVGESVVPRRRGRPPRAGRFIELS